MEAWTKQNGLRISGPKTKAVLFRARNKPVIINDVISLNSVQVEIVSSVKTLGVIFQEHLSWDEHVTLLTKKLSQVVGLLYRHKHIVPPKIKLLIYNTLFSSRLNYCHLVWGTTTQENLQKIHRLQKKVIRMLENVSFYHHTQSLFEKYNVMPATTIFDYRLCKVYKQEVKMGRSFLKQLANLKANNTEYNTRHTEYWSVLTYRTSYGQQMLENLLPRMLNTYLSRNTALEGMTFRNLRNSFFSC